MMSYSSKKLIYPILTLTFLYFQMPSLSAIPVDLEFVVGGGAGIVDNLAVVLASIATAWGAKRYYYTHWRKK